MIETGERIETFAIEGGTAACEQTPGVADIDFGTAVRSIKQVSGIVASK